MTLCSPQGEPGEAKGAKPYNLNDFSGAWPDNDHPMPSVRPPLTACTKPQGTDPSPLSRRTHREATGKV
jgi:hypothetical protein